MIKHLAWKEYREQRAVWIVMTLLTLFLTVGLPFAFGSYADFGVRAAVVANQASVTILAVAMAAAYGLICGSILFAGEEEFQTLPLLDRLTGWRTPIWGAKVVVGCGLVAAQGVLISSILTFRGLEPWVAWWRQWLLWIALLGGFTLEGLAFGMTVSVLCRNALSAAGLSVILYALSWNVTTFIVMAVATGSVFQLRPHTVRDLREVIQFHLPLAFGLHAVLSVFMLWASWRIFCKDDVRRGQSAVLSPSFPVPFPAFHPPRDQVYPALRVNPFQWSSISWLTFRQAWPVALVLCAAGFALVATFGFSDPAEDLWLLAWPSFTLVVGAACGLGTFLGEQARGAERFLGDQRLPVGRIWTIKTGTWLLLAVTVCAFVFVSVEMHGSGAVRAGPEPTRGLFVVLWLVYGFGIGQFCARVARKPVVAAFVSLLLCPVAVIWWPSLVCGGLSAWQVFAAPLVLLVATRLALWEWVAGGPYRGRSPTLIGSAALSALCLAGGIEYRVWQVPDVGEPFDVREYIAKLPKPETNRAGNLARAALENLSRRWWESQHLPPIKNSADVKKPPREATGADPLDEVLVKGWRPGNDELDRQLKYVFSDNWAKRESNLPDLRLGMLAFPRATRFPDLLLGVRLLRARALQLQAGNDSGEALEDLAIALAIIRNAQNHAVHEDEITALSEQKGVFHTFEKCLFAPSLDRQSLRTGLKILSRHASELPSFSDHLEAEYFVIANRFRWLNQEVPAVALQAPWERERQTRLLNATFAGLLRAATSSYPEWLAQYQRHYDYSGAASILQTAGWQKAPQGPGSSLTLDQLGRLIDGSPVGHFVIRPGWGCRLPYEVVVCRLRALELQAALALFQLEKGRPAQKLDELVPSYFSELPLDPFTNKPFGYRISTGEQLRPLSTGGHIMEETRDVAPGQGVVWSAGPDATDNGGTSGGTDFWWYDPLAEKGADLIFLVPIVPLKRDRDNQLPNVWPAGL